MNFALGSSFNIEDMFMNLDLKKLKFTCEQSLKYTHDKHRDCLVYLIFRDCYKLVLLDVINDNVTFKLPINLYDVLIHTFHVEGKDFAHARQNGKYKDIDFLKTNFTGYEIGLFMKSKIRTRRKIIYVDHKMRDLLYKNANEGLLDRGIKIKTLKDYYSIIQNKYPDILISDIKRILNFGFKSLYLHNSYGGDTLIFDSTFWSFIGTLRKDSIKHFLYYIKKLTIKLRVLYKRKNIKWDGYYYFALTDSQYEHYISLKKKRGRPKKYFEYGNQILYKILDECKILRSDRKYIFRMKYPVDIGYTVYKENFVSNNAELIIERDTQKFKDILITNCKYEYL